jgi:hypothetical protein
MVGMLAGLVEIGRLSIRVYAGRASGYRICRRVMIYKKGNPVQSSRETTWGTAKSILTGGIERTSISLP